MSVGQVKKTSFQNNAAQTIGGNDMINIIYNNEVIDTTNDINEALYLKKEYELAFHTTGIEIEINF